MSVTELLELPEVQKAWRELRASGATEGEFVESMCRFTPMDVGRTIREEFEVLPALTVKSLVDAWSLADAGGKRFQFASVAPAQPLVFARRRRVRLTIDVDEDCVTLSLGHIATRHADWYAMNSWNRRTPALAT
jgi:hypothetical protein